MKHERSSSCVPPGSVALSRLRLRPLRADDLEPFLGYRSDPVVARFQGWTPMSRPEAAAFLAAHASASGFIPGRWLQIAIAEASSDLLVGDLGVCLASGQHTAEFGITITPSAQRKGYAVEAIRGLVRLLFSTTPVATVIACTDFRNAACIAALERAGMSGGEPRKAEYKGEACLERVFSVERAERLRGIR